MTTWTITLDGITFTQDDFNKHGYAAIWGTFFNALKNHIQNFLTGTSTTSVAVGTGSKGWTIETGRSFQPGHPVRISRTSDPENTWMSGVVTSYNTGTGALIVAVDDSSGSGTHTDWSVLIGGASGAAGGSPTVNASITASTTQTQGQGALTADINILTTVANDGDTVTLPTPAAGDECVVINKGAEWAYCYPPSGVDLGAGTNSPDFLKPGGIYVFRGISSTEWRGDHMGIQVDSRLGSATVGHNWVNTDNGSVIHRIATDSETRQILGRDGANDTTRSGIELRNDEILFVGDSDAELWRLTKSGFNNPNIVHLWDEFNGDYIAGQLGNLGWRPYYSGTGSFAATTASFATYRKSLGDLYLNPGSTSSGISAVALGPKQFDTGICELDMRWMTVAPNELSTVSEEFVAFVGFANNTNWASATNAIGFLYDRATYGDHWVTVTRSVGVTTYGNTTAIGAEIYDSSPYGCDLRFVVNAEGTSVAFYDGTTPLTAHTTNIPNYGVGGILYPIALINKSAGTTARNLYAARFDLFAKFTDRDPFVS